MSAVECNCIYRSSMHSDCFSISSILYMMSSRFWTLFVVVFMWMIVLEAAEMANRRNCLTALDPMVNCIARYFRTERFYLATFSFTSWTSNLVSRDQSSGLLFYSICLISCTKIRGKKNPSSMLSQRFYDNILAETNYTWFNRYSDEICDFGHFFEIGGIIHLNANESVLSNYSKYDAV